MDGFSVNDLPLDGKTKDDEKLLDNLLFVLQDVSFFCDYIREIKEENKNVKILGADYGTSKTGIAISDESCSIAFPKDVMIGKWQDIKTIIKMLEEKIEQYKAEAIVIGFPKTNAGELHKNCEIIFEIAKYFIFEKKVPTLLFDERYTTKLANKLQNDNKNDDAKSACLILQGVLDCI